MAADDDLDLVAVGVLDELLIAQAVRVQRRLREELPPLRVPQSNQRSPANDPSV